MDILFIKGTILLLLFRIPGLRRLSWTVDIFFFKMIKISFFKKITEVEIFDTVSVFAMNVHVSLQACRCLLREVCVRIQNNVILCYHSFYSSALRWLNFNSVVEFSVWRNDVVGGIKCLVVIPHSIASHSESRIVVASKGKKWITSDQFFGWVSLFPLESCSCYEIIWFFTKYHVNSCPVSCASILSRQVMR